jgi:leader peptidase (prepilin peptidase)/N-methyltransferase
VFSISIFVIAVLATVSTTRGESRAHRPTVAGSAHAAVSAPRADGKREVGPRASRRTDDDLTPGQRANIIVLQAATAAWFFVVGSVLGSFLNVVIYRVPRGMRLSTPPSRCPNCGTHIWRRDNLPIVSWLSLRGRCRACQCRIPYRYPLVEALVAAIFLGLSYVELLSGGTNLPVRMPNYYAGVIWIIWYTKWDLVGIYLFHCCLLCLMLASFLIVRDGFLLPRRLIAFGLVLAVAVSAVFRDIHPVPFSISTSVLLGRAAGTIDNAQMNWPHFWASAPGWLGGFADAVCGAVVGLVVGLPLPLGEVETAARRRSVRNVPAMTALVGAYLGWQAAVSVCLLTAMSGMVLKVGVSRSIPSTGLIRFETQAAFATLVQVFLWKSLDGISGWPSATASRQSLVMPLAALGSYVLTTRLLSPRDQ